MKEQKTIKLYSQKNIFIDEAYSCIYANFLFSSPYTPRKSIAVLSGAPREGKTSVSINLAIKFAQNGLKVLLVDSDLRKPVEAKHLGDGWRIGLYSMFADNVPMEEAICPTNIENLSFIASGIQRGNPYALLSSPAFDRFIEKAKQQFGLIIFDTPALNSVIDGAVIASKTDAAILVVRAGKNSIPKTARVKEQIKKAKANLIGVILNDVKRSEYRKSYEAYDYFTQTF